MSGIAYPLSDEEIRRRKAERRERTRQIERERRGPRKAKRCSCENPVTTVDADGDRWCLWCGRAG